MPRTERPVSARVRILIGVIVAACAALLSVGAVTFAVATAVRPPHDPWPVLAPAAAAYLISTACALVAVGTLTWFTIGRILSPLRHLRDTVDAITLDDLGARVPDVGNDDMRDTTRTVNSMLDRLETSVGAQRQLLDDVRHELKTPITIVRGHLETMNASDPDDVVSTREIGMAELDRMTRLVEDIDLLASVEGGEPLAMTLIDLDALTTHVGELVSAIPGHEWSIATRANGVVNADHDRLVQAWLQLAGNAAKYTPDRSLIELGSTITDDTATLWIRDHGPGIPPAARRRIFQRFDRAHGRRTVGGSGLGLAIVDAIAKAHGGTCTVAETPGGGATFTIALPLRDAPTELPAPIRAGDVVLQRKEIG